VDALERRLRRHLRRFSPCRDLDRGKECERAVGVEIGLYARRGCPGRVPSCHKDLGLHLRGVPETGRKVARGRAAPDPGKGRRGAQGGHRPKVGAPLSLDCDLPGISRRPGGVSLDRHQPPARGIDGERRQLHPPMLAGELDDRGKRKLKSLAQHPGGARHGYAGRCDGSLRPQREPALRRPDDELARRVGSREGVTLGEAREPCHGKPGNGDIHPVGEGAVEAQIAGSFIDVEGLERLRDRGRLFSSQGNPQGVEPHRVSALRRVEPGVDRSRAQSVKGPRKHAQVGRDPAQCSTRMHARERGVRLELPRSADREVWKRAVRRESDEVGVPEVKAPRP